MLYSLNEGCKPYGMCRMLRRERCWLWTPGPWPNECIELEQTEELPSPSRPIAKTFSLFWIR